MSYGQDAHQFVEAVKAALQRRLEAVSLSLLDAGLREYKSEIVVPGVQQFILVGWVIRPATEEVRTFTVRVGVELGHTSIDDVDPMAGSIVGKLVEEFYGGNRA